MRDIEGLIERFEQGAGQLTQDNNKSDLAFDSLYFGEALIEKGFEQEGLEYVLKAKRIYEEIGELAQMPRIKKILSQYGEKIDQEQVLE